MSTTPKGKQFENRVKQALEVFESSYSKQVEITEQPRLVLHDGQSVQPDFQLEIKLHFMNLAFLIECQDRQRSRPDIAHKIKYVKISSDRNNFLFVYPDRIPNDTRKALSADGVLHMSFQEFAVFINRLGELLKLADTLSYDPPRRDWSEILRPYEPPTSRSECRS